MSYKYVKLSVIVAHCKIFQNFRRSGEIILITQPTLFFPLYINWDVHTLYGTLVFALLFQCHIPCRCDIDIFHVRCDQNRGRIGMNGYVSFQGLLYHAYCIPEHHPWEQILTLVFKTHLPFLHPDHQCILSFS